MDRLKDTHDVEVHWRAFELRPAGAPPLPPEYRARIEASRPRLEEIARQHYGMEINSGPFGINSRPALVGAKYAEAQGLGEAYNAAVLRAYWQDARDIGDVAVLRGIAESVGLDVAAFEEALQNPDYEMAVTHDVNLAQQYGLSGVPALIFERKYLVSGAQPYEVLAQVVDELSKQNRVSGV